MISRVRSGLWIASLALSCVGPGGAVSQQEIPAADTLRLGFLQQSAILRDPRGHQIDLLAAQSAMRRGSLAAERLPSLSVLGRGQYQSDVVTIPFELPTGVSRPVQPNDSYDAHLAAVQSLYDPTAGARAGVEQARLAESQARVRSALHDVRQNVNEAFFTVLLLRAQGDELETAIADLESQLEVAAERVREGAALPSETASLEVALLRRRQSLAQLEAERNAAAMVLADLTGQPVTAAPALAIPDLGDQVVRARSALDDLRRRPEYEQFARARDLLERQRKSISARKLPRLSAFGRAGYGRPGLNPLASEFDSYWLSGLQVEWRPWTWGTNRREREELALQEDIVATEEAAFEAAIRRAATRELARIDRLERAFETDDRVIVLREQILRETRFRFVEGVITSADYVDRQTDLLDARLARATHRVELEQARARFLTLIGFEIP